MTTSPLSRRRLLGTAGAAGAAGLVAGAAGGVAGTALAGDDTPPLSTVGSTTVMFHGKHQAGITTAPQSAAIWPPSICCRTSAGRGRQPCCAAGPGRPNA